MTSVSRIEVIRRLNLITGKIGEIHAEIPSTAVSEFDSSKISEKTVELGEAIEHYMELIPEVGLSDISDFFANVGRSVVSAQDQLDAESDRYNRRIRDQADDALIPPTNYRVPKATATFKFAMSSATSRGFNVFVASSETMQRRAAEQEVSFEIVAAQPPPEVMAKLARLPAEPGSSLVRNSAERGEAQRLFLAADRGPSGLWRSQADLKSILVFRDVVPEEEPRRRWRLVYVGRPSDPGDTGAWELGFAVLSENKDQTPIFEPVRAGTSSGFKVKVSGSIQVALAALLNDLLPKEE